MGIIYALKSFFSGQQHTIKLNASKIKVSVMKLIQTIKLKQSNLKKQAEKREAEYIRIINGPAHNRGMNTERVYLDDQVKNSYLFTALQQIIRLAQIIKNQAKILEQDSSKMSNQCFKAVCSVVYCYQQLELDQMIKLSDFIPEPYPKISSSKLTPPLLQFIKKKKPTYYEINLYVLEMMQRNKSLTLQRINGSGFQFQLNPKVPQKDSGSSMMFAMEDISQQQMMKIESEMQPKLGQYNNFQKTQYENPVNNFQKNGSNYNASNDDDDFAC